MEPLTGRMGLGGAQFGMAYGVTGNNQQPNVDLVHLILGRALEAGVRFLDTAPAYGDSESTIGLSGLSSGFRIVSKTPKGLGSLSAGDAQDRLRHAIELSLSRLKVNSLDSILVHDAVDLLGEGGSLLWAALERCKDEGLCDRIGASLYRADEVDRVLERFPVDLVQVPYNVLDRRLVDGGQFSRLAETGIAIHVRSIFLQGLLLARPEDIPARFAPTARAVREFRGWVEAQGMTVPQAIIADVFRRPEIECCLFGTHSLQEFDGILHAARAAARGTHFNSFDASSQLCDQMLDPSRWSELT